ncbi:MAG: DUF1549 domain-containing protein [Planctomycetaceae bacterium]
MNIRFCLWTLVVAIAWGVPSSARAQETAPVTDNLSARIDELIAANRIGPLAPPASDAEFIRRLYLDLVGRVPSITEVRTFLADATPEKRNILIDQLISSPEHARRMSIFLDISMMERRGDTNVPTAEWRQYLFTSYQSGKPFHQMAAEILGANGIDPAQRGQAKFYLDRESEPNLITRDVGRVFFGIDLQCAQCHNHPLIESYHQTDYYGLFAFVSRNFPFAQEDQNKRIVLAERAEGEVDFKSVFTGDIGRTLPRLPGDVEVAEPSFPPGEEYEVKPADKVIPVPKYSRRAKFAQLVAEGKNRAFQRNISNRIWGFMMGRGLINPVDLHHLDNLSTHPDLSTLLADELAKRNFDVRSLIRDIARTQAYQRAFQMPADSLLQIEPVIAQLPQIEAKVQEVNQLVAQSVQGMEAAQAAFNPVFKTATDKAQEALNARAAASETRKAVDAALAAVAEVKTQLTAKQDVHVSVKAAADQALAAVQKLPNEPELAQAAEKFNARAAQLAAEVDGLTKAVAEKETALPPVNEKHAAALKAMTDVETLLTEARTVANQIHQPLLAAQLQVEQQKSLLRKTERQVKEIQHLLKSRELTQAVETVAAAIPPIEAQVAALTQTQEQLKTEVAAAETTVTASQLVMAEKEKLVVASQEEQATKQGKAKAVGDALASAQVALEKLPGDAVLTETVGKLKTLNDQMIQEVDSATKVVAEKQAELKTAQDTVTAAQLSLDGVRKKLDETVQQATATQQQLAAAQEQVKAQQTAVADNAAVITELWTSQYAVAPLKPLNAEQFVWSVMQVLGLVDQQKAAVEAAWIAQNPPTEANQNDLAYLTAKANHIEQTVYNNLLGNVTTFVTLYGASAGQPQEDFFATADQALFLANGGVIDGWLNPSGGNLSERLLQQTDPKLFSEELYLAVLSRNPSEEEAAEVTQYLAARGEARNSAVKELVWALLTSSEFRFNH